MNKKNLVKKDLVNAIYMQLGFSKKISENYRQVLLLTFLNALITSF